jgi:hypothetical protein
MSVAIYQIYFRRWQRKYLDRALIGYDNTANTQPAFAEYHVFKTEFENGNALDADLTGYLSWKFQRKSRVSGRRLKAFIDQNPGYDVYFVNPFPDLVVRWKNPWEQGERNHPGLASYARTMMSEIYPDIDVSGMVGTQENVCYCNFWIGNEKFWREYMAFSLPVYDYIKNAAEEDRAFLFSAADQSGRSSYIPYLMERLFTTFLITRPDIRAFGYRYTPDELRRKYGRAAPAVDKANGLKSMLIERGVEFDDVLQSFVGGIVRQELVRFRQSWSQSAIRLVRSTLFSHLY